MKPLSLTFLRAIGGFGVLLIISVLLLGQGISLANSSVSTMPITCNIMPTIEVSFPVALELGNVSPDPDISVSYVVSDAQAVRVWSNTKWALKIQSDAMDGRLKEWTGVEYTSRALSFPLEWQLDEESDFNRMTGNETTIVEDQAPTDHNGRVLRLRFRQQITYNDVPLLDSANIYRIEVMFTALQTY